MGVRLGHPDSPVTRAGEADIDTGTGASKLPLPPWSPGNRFCREGTGPSALSRLAFFGVGSDGQGHRRRVKKVNEKFHAVPARRDS
jgi:hypothetical protein